MQKEIKHQFTLLQPPHVVWEYLTNPELLAQWLMPNDFRPVVGHRFEFKANPKLKFGFDGRIYCEVLEIIPHKKLVYTWKGGQPKENPTLDSVVVWTLTPVDKGTILTLEQKGFKGIKNYLPYIIMKKGWEKIGRRLFNFINMEHNGKY